MSNIMTFLTSFVSNHCERSTGRMMFPFVSADRYGLEQACKHTCWVLESSRKFFHATQRWEWLSFTVSFGRAQNHRCTNLAWGGIKFEKWASAHVWNRKMRLKHRMMFPCVSAERYGPKGVRTLIVCLAWPPIFFSSPTKFLFPPQNQIYPQMKIFSFT